MDIIHSPPLPSCLKKQFIYSLKVSHTVMRLLNFQKQLIRDFPGGPVVKNLPTNAGG